MDDGVHQGIGRRKLCQGLAIRVTGNVVCHLIGRGEDSLKVPAALAARYSKSTVGANRLIIVYHIRDIINHVSQIRARETKSMRATDG